MHSYRGESGAGKTENTKKVIMYFAKVAAQLQKGTLEETEKDGAKKVVSHIWKSIARTNIMLIINLKIEQVHV